MNGLHFAKGRAATFGDFAVREGKFERHVRFLAPLAFLSPRIVQGSVPADLTVTTLARALAKAWAEQERKFGMA